MMNHILGPYVNKFEIVYLDDIIIYSKTKKENLVRVKKVLNFRSEHQLYAKPSKCILGVQNLNFSGHVISKAMVKRKILK